MKTYRTEFPLDSSAIIHLAAMKKGYTNSFRLCVELSDAICPQMLQAAVDIVVPQFPTIAAGIRRGLFQYTVVPVTEPPKVCLEQEYLADMSASMIKRCALRILYCDNRIAVEIFHSLTDGYGGLMFFNTLIAEYLYQCGLISKSTVESLHCTDGMEAEATADDYVTYAGTNTEPLNHQKVYKLPVTSDPNQKITITTQIYNTQELIAAAHYFGVSLTVFLTAVMAEAIFEMQKDYPDTKAQEQPLQIMIPVNLRKKFASKSLRNFSLYALPCITPFQGQSHFDELIASIAVQLKKQFSKEHLMALMTTSVKLQKKQFLRFVPLHIKIFFLRIGFYFCGERNSCLTLSNLGEVTYPPEMKQYIQQVDFSLTPRRNAPYNCGMVSYNGKLAVNFTQKNSNKTLEWYFSKCLADMGYLADAKLENYSKIHLQKA